MAKLYKVITRDVDGSSNRSYSSWESAAKRFEEMAGCPLPKGHREFSEVSDYGTVVEFEAAWNAEIPAYPVEAEGNVDGDEVDDEDESPFPTYGGPEHQTHGDRWLYADCPGAW